MALPRGLSLVLKSLKSTSAPRRSWSHSPVASGGRGGGVLDRAGLLVQTALGHCNSQITSQLRDALRVGDGR